MWYYGKKKNKETMNNIIYFDNNKILKLIYYKIMFILL